MSGIDIISYKLGQKSAGGGSGGGAIALQDKTITENGTYTAAAGYDGLGTVTVNVAGSGGSDEDWIIGDGNTHLWITLTEGRTSPMVGVCPKGTVTVDWGDGSTPDVLTGTSEYINTSSVRWTPSHEYAAAGDYVITLTVDGTMGIGGDSSYNGYAWILRHSSGADLRNTAYQASLRKVEIGDSVSRIGPYAFYNCCGLSSVNISDSVAFIDEYAFYDCYGLSSINIPDGVTSIGGSAFKNCYELSSIVIPDSVSKVGDYTFQNCYGLSSVILPDGITSIGGYAFQSCTNLPEIKIPDSVIGIGGSAFQNCYNLSEIKMPTGVTTVAANTFSNCAALVNVVFGDVTSIAGGAFSGNYSVAAYDFSACKAVPTLSGTSAFQNIPADCEIRVPAALVNEWKAATNWSTYADYIVGV